MSSGRTGAVFYTVLAAGAVSAAVTDDAQAQSAIAAPGNHAFLHF